MRERFLDSCDDRLALYLRERSPTDLDEVVSLADHYLDARFNKGIRNREANGDKSTFYDSHSRPCRSDSRVSEGVHSELKPPARSRVSKPQSGEERVCYKCGLPGHIRRDCKQKSVAEIRQHSSHDSAAICELVSD